MGWKGHLKSALLQPLPDGGGDHKFWIWCWFWLRFSFWLWFGDDLRFDHVVRFRIGLKLDRGAWLGVSFGYRIHLFLLGHLFVDGNRSRGDGAVQPGCCGGLACVVLGAKTSGESTGAGLGQERVLDQRRCRW